MYQPSHILARRRYIKSRAKRDFQALPIPETSINKENIMERKTSNLIVAICAVTLTLIVGCAVISGVGYAVFGTTLFPQPAMNSNPLIDNTDPEIYAKPNNEGQMSTSGHITYTQSGKPNEQTVSGRIGQHQSLVVTAYEIVYQGDIYTGGVVWVIPGPYNLDDYPFIMKDGAATLTSNNSVQAKLDSMYVDFCRGDRDGDWWSYQPWALNHVLVPDQYYFPANTYGCFNAAGDIYPSFLPRP